MYNTIYSYVYNSLMNCCSVIFLSHIISSAHTFMSIANSFPIRGSAKRTYIAIRD